MTDDDRIQVVFSSVFDACPPVVRDDDGMHSIPGWDSVGQLNLIMAFESEFSVEFEIADIENLTTVGAIRRTLAEK